MGSDDLLPCPFCGGVATSHGYADGCPWCVNCGAQGPDTDMSKKAARDAWNRRADIPRAGVLVPDGELTKLHTQVANAVESAEVRGRALERAEEREGALREAILGVLQANEWDRVDWTTVCTMRRRCGCRATNGRSSALGSATPVGHEQACPWAVLRRALKADSSVVKIEQPDGKERAE